jgi:CheY-like chemotaxis protein
VCPGIIIRISMQYILLVDDDEDEHLFFQWSLEKINRNISLISTFTGDQAIKLLDTTIPEMIFLDINLPGADGFECLEKMKGIINEKRIPVFLYSTEITEQTIRRAKALNAAGCIRKARNHIGLSQNIIELLNGIRVRSFEENVLLK